MASSQSSPSRNFPESEALHTAVPVAFSGRQIPASRNRTSHSNSTTPISTNASISNIVSGPLLNGNRQGLNNPHQFGTQNGHQTLPNGRSANTGTSGAGAIPRRSMSRRNNVAEEERKNEKQDMQ